MKQTTASWILASLTNVGIAAPAFAMAPSGQAADGGSLLGSLPFLLMMVAVMYFLVIRPQKKQADNHKKFLAGLQKGDEVVTTGGLCGKVVGVADNLVTLEIAANTKVKVLKGNIHKFSGTANVTPISAAVAEK